MKRANDMKRPLPLLPFLLIMYTTLASAQLYKWVGPDGKVNYTDTPPATGHVETKSRTASGGSGADFPYELSETVKNHPVTLYTTTNCTPCDEGRKLLTSRGIPFTEKTVNNNDDIAQFKKISSDGQLPFLIVGRSKERGFETSVWHAALTAAGYPETSKLPKNYRQPQPEAAAPLTKDNAPKVEGTTNSEKTPSRPNTIQPPPPIGNVPPGFRF